MSFCVSKRMNHLVKMVCAIHQVSPAEVNFPNSAGVGGSGGSIFESIQEARMKNSQDKGLKPLLRFMDASADRNIVSRFAEEFVFCFTGVNDKTENEKAEPE